MRDIIEDLETLERDGCVRYSQYSDPYAKIWVEVGWEKEQGVYVVRTCCETTTGEREPDGALVVFNRDAGALAALFYAESIARLLLPVHQSDLDRLKMTTEERPHAMRGLAVKYGYGVVGSNDREFEEFTRVNKAVQRWQN